MRTALLLALVLLGCASAQTAEPVTEPVAEEPGSVSDQAAPAARTDLVPCVLPPHVSPSPAPECPGGQVPSVVGETWGPCVNASLCACTSFARDCPNITGYSEGCYQGHCGPWLR
jgi:hypothetical protein